MKKPHPWHKSLFQSPGNHFLNLWVTHVAGGEIQKLSQITCNFWLARSHALRCWTAVSLHRFIKQFSTKVCLSLIPGTKVCSKALAIIFWICWWLMLPLWFELLVLSLIAMNGCTVPACSNPVRTEFEPCSNPVADLILWSCCEFEPALIDRGAWTL